MKNKFKIIETPDYILAVSDEAIEEGNYVYQVNFEKTNTQVIQCIKPFQAKIANDKNGSFTKLKIIAYKPKRNSPELDLPLLPEMVVEDNIEKFADINGYHESDLDKIYKEGFRDGHKAATKVYSENDLKKAFNFGTNEGYNYKDLESMDEEPEELSEEDWNSFVRNLNQPKTPKWFVAETEDIFHSPSPIGMSVDTVLKTTTINGKIYLAGNYKK
jgi:hypothetical protein